MRSWIYLFIAIVAEVIGTASMKFHVSDSPLLSHGLMYVMIGLSYGFLALAVKRVPLGVAYALWEGIGIVLITLVSVTWLGETLGLLKALGLGVMIAGILLIKSGTRSAKAVRETEREALPC
ncbi:SMR family transporter [Pseudomonas fontis]|uniref:Spermidine export protein MdtJ n=1 Tax=Pseudomonas fontis TaxID=2942633 RepID=A0ABT5NZP5_9PSED|nr:SMR family transporter [Pseudomonas fontis]MDD0974093.1 SMR family transporter [Pseudomonas fontis]MDD0993650.1 SMR family transporter [Pseudomonas fontis]